MTKKDYEMFAECIKKSQNVDGLSEAEKEGLMLGLKRVAIKFSVEARMDNERFNQSMFLKACGF